MKALFYGLGAGLAAGLLLAPMRGAKTRALIAKNAQKCQTLIREELSDVATEAIERGTRAAKVTVSGVVEAFEHGKQVLNG